MINKLKQYISKILCMLKSVSLSSVIVVVLIGYFIYRVEKNDYLTLVLGQESYQSLAIVSAFICGEFGLLAFLKVNKRNYDVKEKEVENEVNNNEA